jgi:ADP-ribose pyrophosphatase YjhB (NUDIX family)
MGIEIVGNKGFALAVDTLIFSVSSVDAGNSRKLSDKYFSVLLVKRNKPPFCGRWCLPGGFVTPSETLGQAADRILAKETNLRSVYKEQLYAFSAVNRDPRRRVVSVAYQSLLDKNRITDSLSDEARWFNIESIETADDRVDIEMSDGNEVIVFSVRKSSQSAIDGPHDYEVLDNQRLAFDHPLMIVAGVESLRRRIKSTDIVFNMMPARFTLGELQQVYEAILGEKLLAPAFRRTIADKVEGLGVKVRTGGHRPSELFRYKGGRMEKIND